MKSLNSSTSKGFFIGFGYNITVFIFLSYRYSYFRGPFLGGCSRPFNVLLLSILNNCIKAKCCQKPSISVSISWLLIQKLYKLVSYVILPVAIFVHNKGRPDSTDTSHKAHECFTMLADIQLDI